MSRTQQLLILGMVLVSQFSPFGGNPKAYAQKNQTREYSVQVIEKKVSLSTKPEKIVTVWAYGLEGQQATVPGPVIKANVGDLVKVHFKNTHGIPHTMHFHGIHPFNMDGNGQRQLGKEQLQYEGEEYTYEFLAKYPGYYLYHCHFDTANHIDHGMYGLFIVEDPSWPKVDQEWLTLWDEWDVNGDGKYETHTINTKSFPDTVPFKAKVGERIRIVLANIGYEHHTPHLHGASWKVVDPANPSRVVTHDHNTVVGVGPGEIKVVEFTPEHEGTWLFHCHVVPHVADDGDYPKGMLTLVTVESTQSS